ncbi:sensor histidine kinase [Roseofilum casamattae]|uniref:histidine kinase n=1 Tax=Roseofilum casamattae BLCC-M143 TaxID=3022442 RepID=A0ABT7C2Q4_9CYAN|nr:ATP-binding protein [Roseofilum casamattae]MDJ1185741.1 ATP-binding protein [Roseofilum casamattae BLCC-M143]
MEQQDYEKQIRQLEKTIRILGKKLERSEQERSDIEADVAAKEVFLKNAIEQLQVSQQELEQRTQDLQNALNEMQQIQLQLIQSEKMSALGQMVAGVAHEINNPLSFVYGNLEHAREYTASFLELLKLYQQYYPQPHPAIADAIVEMDLPFLEGDTFELFQSMQDGADRIKNIITSLRTFSRLDEADFKTIDIHEGIESTLTLLQTRLRAQNWRSQIEVRKEYGHLPQLKCYAGQLNQVFMSILSNSIDAIEQCLAENTSRTKVQPQIAIRTICQSNVQSEHQEIIISISDNGIGISPENIDRIFDPFFTTKDIGKGTGLGMAIAHQIITEKHNGTITCSSELNKGTTFAIILPTPQLTFGKNTKELEEKKLQIPPAFEPLMSR